MQPFKSKRKEFERTKPLRVDQLSHPRYKSRGHKQKLLQPGDVGDEVQGSSIYTAFEMYHCRAQDKTNLGGNPFGSVPDENEHHPGLRNHCVDLK